jgi:hypothetical protein
MPNRYNAPHQVRKQPTTRINPDQRTRLNEFAYALGITQYEALGMILDAGFQTLENSPLTIRRKTA